MNTRLVDLCVPWARPSRLRAARLGRGARPSPRAMFSHMLRGCLHHADARHAGRGGVCSLKDKKIVERLVRCASRSLTPADARPYPAPGFVHCRDESRGPSSCSPTLAASLALGGARMPGLLSAAISVRQVLD